ncbi:MAG: hypothetical protein GY809_32420 [Planctomycetes bacterium]|nr:hypothetical protein [Planctomycetota bacterium]
MSSCAKAGRGQEELDAALFGQMLSMAKDKVLIQKSGLVLSTDEWALLAINDLGLGDITSEGFAFVDILRAAQLRITVLVLQ